MIEPSEPSEPSEPRKRIRYDANVCGGDFRDVRERFDTWKRESRVHRPERRVFDGKDEVRELNHTVYAGPESAQRALVARCAPADPFALAVRLAAEGRTLWLVMAAYDA
ncbi:hypothetical protein WI28_22805 [Burkholderia diffusa]|uniref:hypothetical protein n=1 Tax=Burkholderia diffusa TaxID=488732 RepID=UPI00075334E4|nr:hypothetical protein [Burkholderia diffusa]KUZ06958.1 hypothetical protein WI28_22805 [Burkholderia diffusa]